MKENEVTKGETLQALKDWKETLTYRPTHEEIWKGAIEWISIHNQVNELHEVLVYEDIRIENEWLKAKNEIYHLIEPKYFEFVEDHDTYFSEGIVNIVEVKEKNLGYNTYPHCREVNTVDKRLYIKHTIQLETENESKYNGEEIIYWVWQQTGHLGDDYSGFFLLPLTDGRYWKIGYSC